VIGKFQATALAIRCQKAIDLMSNPFIPKRARRLSFDPACRELADHFLSTSGWTEAERNDLSQDIQEAVENWLEDHEADPNPGSACALTLGG
jgi:hypothetical protein